MEKTSVKPKLSDIIPFYGAVNYIERTRYNRLEREEPSIGSQATRSFFTLAHLVYNSFILMEFGGLLLGKPSPTKILLENLLK